MQEINIKLDIFEGPLDLLLHLIKKLELDIYDIPISAVTKQYMNYIHAMQSLELEVAGEYLVMAATLMAIKSKMLLPKQELEAIDEEEVEGEDPREALVTQLLEYRKFKYAAGLLHEKETERSLYYTKEPMDVEEYREEQLLLEPNKLNTIDLFLAFHSMLEKRKKRKPVQTTVAGEDVSIEMKLAELTKIIKGLEQNKPIELESFFETYSKQEIVTTFMALLELMKTHLVRVEQESNYGTILLYNDHDHETTNDLEETS